MQRPAGLHKMGATPDPVSITQQNTVRCRNNVMVGTETGQLT